MAGVRVGSLDLKLVAPTALQNGAATLQRGAEEALIPAVLRAMEWRLVRAHGERAVIRIGSIDIRLKLNPSDLASSRLAEALGEDIAKQLLGQATVETASAHAQQAGASVRVWKDARQLTAARLGAAARREVGPDNIEEGFNDLWRSVTRENPADIVRVLGELAGVQQLSPVLDRLPLEALTELGKAVASVAPATVVRAIDHAISLRRGTTKPAGQTGSGPDGQAFSDAAGTVPEPGPAPPDPPRRHTGRNIAQSRTPDRKTVSEDDERNEGTEARIGPDAQPRPPTAAPGDAPLTPSSADPPDEAMLRAPSEPDSPHEDLDVRPDLADAALDPWHPATFPSNWCALAYLLPIAIRTELPEALWQAGLDEGAILCRALALIAGDEDDPLVRILSRRFPDLPPAVGRVADWAREEVTRAALDHAVALGEDRDVLAGRIALFHACLSVDDGCDFAAWLAAYLLAIFENRTGHTVEPGRFDRCFARPGRIEIADDVIHIVQPLEAIDIDIRRAGLDGDPGWLPWIEKHMAFVFESDEEA